MRNLDASSLLFNYSKFFSKFPVLKMEGFVLRELMLADKDKYYALLSDPEVNKYLSDEDIPASVEEALSDLKFWSSLFHKRYSVYWALAEEKSNDLVGTIGFHSWNFYNSRAEISYELASSYWRQGIMSRAVEQVLKFAFHNMGVNRVEAKTMWENSPSQNFLLKIGFQQEATLLEYRKVRGRFVDIITYSLLRRHFLTKTERELNPGSLVLPQEE